MTTKTYRIKPLVWEENEAASSTAFYHIRHNCYGYVVEFLEPSKCYNETFDKVFASNEEAKAAAQEHYETRLKQCLEEVE